AVAAEVLLVASGDDRGERRETPGRGVVRDREDGAVAGQQVEVRRRGRRDRRPGLHTATLAGAAVIAVALVVRDEEDHVGTGRDRRGCAGLSVTRADTVGRTRGAARAHPFDDGAAGCVARPVIRGVEDRRRLALAQTRRPFELLRLRGNRSDSGRDQGQQEREGDGERTGPHDSLRDHTGGVAATDKWRFPSAFGRVWPATWRTARRIPPRPAAVPPTLPTPATERAR